MDHIGGVHVESPPQHLIDEILNVLVGQFLAISWEEESAGSAWGRRLRLGSVCFQLESSGSVEREYLPRVDHSMQICFHQVIDDVDVLVPRYCLRPYQVDYRNYVVVVEKFYDARVRLSRQITDYWQPYRGSFELGSAARST